MLMLKDMKRPSLGLVCLTLLFLCKTNFARDLTSVEMAARLDEFTVFIKVNRSITQDGGFGSGFFVKPNLIATNYHVIKGASARDIMYKRVDKKGFHSIKSVRAVDSKHDLAILEVPWTRVKLAPIGNSDLVKKGEEVYVSGNPKGLEGTFSDGKLSAIRTDFTIKVFQISAPISRGSSGGPVCNNRGVVIGVATWIRKSEIQFKSAEIELDVPQNLNFAVPSKYLRSLLNRYGIPLPPPPKPDLDYSTTQRKKDEQAQAAAEKAKAEADRAKAEARKVEAEARKAEAERAKAEAESAKKEKAKILEPKAHLTERLKAATVRIIGKAPNGEESLLGMGFFVEPNQVATDFHVVDGAELIGVKRFRQGTKSADVLLGAKLLKTDKMRHLAILEVEKKEAKPLSLGNSGKVDRDDKIYVVQDPSQGKISEGTISKILDIDGVLYFQLDAEVLPASSGGPIANTTGEVIAVTALKVPKLDGSLNYAIPAIYLEGLRAKPPDPPPTDPRPEPPDILPPDDGPDPEPIVNPAHDNLLKPGIEFYKSAQFREAVEALQSVLKRLDKPKERARAHLYLGFSKWGLADTKSSVSAEFREALRYNPSVTLPDDVGQDHPVFKPLLEKARQESTGILTISASPPETEVWIFGGEMKRSLLGSGSVSIRLFKGNYAVEGILEGAHKVVSVLIKPNDREEISLVMPTEAPPSHEFELTLDLFSAEKPKDVKVHYTIYDADGNQLDQDKKEMQLREEKPESSTWVYHVKLPSAPQGGKIAYRIEADGKIIRDDPQVEILEPPESALIDINQTVPIKARVVSNVAVRGVRVYYDSPRTLSKSSPSQVLARESNSNTYIGEIPVDRNHTDGATWFYVRATTGEEDKTTRSATRAVRAKRLEPATLKITLEPVPDPLPINKPISIKAEVKSSAPLKEVRVYYDFPRKRLSETSPSSMLENKSSSDKYNGEIPKEHNREEGYIWYFVSATTEKGVKSQTEDSVIEVKKLPTWRHEGVWASHSWSSFVQNNAPFNSDWERGNLVNLAYLREGKGFPILGAQLDFGYENSINTSAIVQWGPRMKESAIAFAFLAGIAGYRDSDSDIAQNSNRPTQLTPLVGGSLKFYPLDRASIDFAGTIKLRSTNGAGDRESDFTRTLLHHYEMGIRLYISPSLNLKAGYGEWRLGEYHNTSVQVGLGATF